MGDRDDKTALDEIGRPADRTAPIRRPGAEPSAARAARPKPGGASAAARPKLGLVLGAGAARGWAHIGALRALDRLGVRPDVMVGCSSGALVAASYATGRLDSLEAFARSLTWRGVIGYFDFTWRGGGLIEGRWLVDFFRKHVGDVAIEATPIRFGAVATELETGRETWLTEGSIVDAVRASISLPAIVAPIRLGDHWLVDGALVNPIPVSLCRALGADVIVAVSMQGDLVTNRRSVRQALRPRARPAAEPSLDTLAERAMSRPDALAAAQTQSSWLEWLSSGWTGRGAGASAAAATPPAPPGRPGYFDVIGDSFFTVQNFVSRVRLAADPVDILIAPDLQGFGVFDFHRGVEAIEAGEAAVMARADELRALVDALDTIPRA